MEIILAIVVVMAVIFFGALISMGNEHQRRAIDGLREQATLWAVQDLQLKRERLAQGAKVDNPRNWLNSITSRICSFDLDLQIVEFFDQPRALYCTSADGSCKIIFTPHSPSDIRNIRKSQLSRLDRFNGHNPLLSLPKYTKSHELSALNNGVLFDLELELVWKQLTGQSLKSTNRFWLYEYS
jgi:hypothetical protein